MKNPFLNLNHLILIFLFITAGSARAQHHQMSTDQLQMPGNDVFGTIQEVILKLESNPDTDWSKVNIEALRQHLLDMKAFTEEVEVISQTPVDNGIAVQVSPQTKRAGEALNRLFKMHPMMLKQEKGWDMDSQIKGEGFLITVTTPDAAEVAKVRALSYIGILAEGAHHQAHHWMIATGQIHQE